jgi:DNA helicase-2/ATP-dependent DNA helicase PcrA
LEFKNVFVVGLEENLFPSQMSMDSMRGLEEERRLFYVAITRAEEHCYLSFAKSRYKFGKTEFSSPSRFLKDIDTCYLSLPQGERMASQVDEAASRFRSQPMASRFAESSRPKTQVVPPAQPTRTLKKVSSISPSRPAASPSVGALQVGNVIEHERFGVGEVVNVVGTGDNCKATVRFRNAGEKQLLLKFARFKIIS